MVNSDPIGYRPLRQRNKGSTNDRHDHDSGTVPRQRAQFRYPQSEDAREHDGVKKSDQNNAPHGEMSRADHRNGHEGGSAH